MKSNRQLWLTDLVFVNLCQSIFVKPLATGVFLCYNATVAKNHAFLFNGGVLQGRIAVGENRIMTQVRDGKYILWENAEEINQTEVRK